MIEFPDYQDITVNDFSHRGSTLAKKGTAPARVREFEGARKRRPLPEAPGHSRPAVHLDQGCMAPASPCSWWIRSASKSEGCRAAAR